MTQEMIKEGNMLIAKFMGHTVSENGFTVEGKGFCLHPLDMGYETSWNTLMPVVEKLDEFEDVTVKMVGSRTSITIGKKRFVCHTICRLNSTYRAVIDFIKYYNTLPA